MKLLLWLHVSVLVTKNCTHELFARTSFFCTVFLPNADMMNKNFDLFIPNDLNATDAQKKEWGDMLRKFYFDEKALSSDSIDEFTMVKNDMDLHFRFITYLGLKKN